MINLLVLFGLITGILSGCGGGGGSSSQSGPSPTGSVISIAGLDSRIVGLSAELNMTGVGVYQMDVNDNNTVSTTLPVITPGWYTITLTYTAENVIVAQTSLFVEIVAGQDVSLLLSSQDLDRNFDDDFDGWVNLAEVLWGTEPLLALSLPQSEDPWFAQSVAGGTVLSASYEVYDASGEAIASGVSSSFTYTQTGGFVAFQ